MTSLSRRAFVTAAAASLLVSCGGGGGGNGGGGERDGGSGQNGQGTAARSGSTSSPSRSSTDPVRPLGRSVPSGLRIPAIGVDTPVMRLGLAPDGTVQVPPITAHDQAGWYRHSPTPGQVGPSVILGHVTVGSYGDGVFHDLKRLRQGDRIEARLENGTTAVFAVDSVRTVAKAHFPADEVYGDVNRPELRLITCGGARSGGGYLDNVIVFATMSSAGH
ncbi:class F sortase [Streptomyces sp. NPDC006332]|uniref:class F sortase n=1 Tax=Streptomyces sp. NPDC006332 TaxID=3155456 RepID=UPI0033A5383D